MVQVPKTRQVKVRPIATPFQSPGGVSPEAFGGGRARGGAQLAQALSNVGQATGQIAITAIERYRYYLRV